MSTLTFQAFFISFLLLVFLIETSGNSISFLAVIIVDVLLVYFNHDKCYNNECIYYYQLHYITFLGRCYLILGNFKDGDLKNGMRFTLCQNMYCITLHVGKSGQFRLCKVTHFSFIVRFHRWSFSKVEGVFTIRAKVHWQLRNYTENKNHDMDKCDTHEIC